MSRARSRLERFEARIEVIPAATVARMHLQNGNTFKFIKTVLEVVSAIGFSEGISYLIEGDR